MKDLEAMKTLETAEEQLKRLLEYTLTPTTIALECNQEHYAHALEDTQSAISELLMVH